MDVIVVGAGPAGSTAAKAVAESGYSVTVYEKGPLRREKPCGGGVSDRVEKEFNLNPEDKFWDRECRGIFVCSPQNKSVVLMDKTGGKGYLVMRETHIFVDLDGSSTSDYYWNIIDTDITSIESLNHCISPGKNLYLDILRKYKDNYYSRLRKHEKRNTRQC